MFEWLLNALNNKNNNEDVIVNEKNKMEYLANFDTNLLISTWMSKNNITDLTFEEILYQLGLVYDEKLSIDKSQISISNPLWNNPDFLGVLGFTKWCTRFNENNRSINNKFSEHLKNITSDNHIQHYIFLYNNSISTQVHYEYYDNDRGTVKCIITREYSIKKNEEGKTSLEENKEIYKTNKRSNSIYSGYNSYVYDRTSTKDEINIIVSKFNSRTQEDKILIKIVSNNNTVIDEKKLMKRLWNMENNNDIFQVLEDIYNNTVAGSDYFDSIDITFVKGKEIVKELSYNLCDLIYDSKVIVKTNNYNRDCNIENYIENGLYCRKLTINKGQNVLVLKVKSTNKISLDNELKVISYLISSSWNYADDLFKRISDLSFSNPSNDLMSVELYNYINNKIFDKKEWKRNYQINEVNIENSDNLERTDSVLKRKK